MQPGFFDQEDRLARLEKLGDPLSRLDSIVDWQGFRPLLKVIHHEQRKSNAGRKPHDVTLMFKMLVLQALYNLSDDQTEFQVRDRLSFQRFLGLAPEDNVPDRQDVVAVPRAVGAPRADRLAVPTLWRATLGVGADAQGRLDHRRQPGQRAEKPQHPGREPAGPLGGQCPHAVKRNVGIPGYDDQALRLGLCDQHAVERVAVVHRQCAGLFTMKKSNR